MKMKNWTAEEIRTLETNYPILGGVFAMAESGLLPGRSIAAIRNQVEKLGITTQRYAKAREESGPNWPVPSMEANESDACQLLREWRGPAEPNPAWRIAR